MPTAKFGLYLILLILALVLAVFIGVFGLIDKARAAATIISIMTTLFIVSSVELVPELARRLAERSRAAKFARFFGRAAVEGEVRLVFAHRQLRALSDPWITHYRVPEIEGSRPIPEGVNAWLAAQDIRAAVYLANTFSKFNDRDFKIIHDKDIDSDDFDYCAVSIGLGFNGFTHRLATLCANRLFRIEWGDSIKATFTEKTDNFELGSDHVPIPPPPNGEDYCIVARVVPTTAPGRPKRVCFVCAGRTAAGTAAAGFFLANHWLKLLELYDVHDKSLDTESMAAVVRHVCDDSGAELPSTAELVCQDDKAVICCWARVPGVE